LASSRIGLKRKAPLAKDPILKKQSNAISNHSGISSIISGISSNNSVINELQSNEGLSETDDLLESDSAIDEKVEIEDEEKLQEIIESPLKKSRLDPSSKSLIPDRSRSIALLKAAKLKMQSKTLKPRMTKDQENREQNQDETENSSENANDTKTGKKRRNSVNSIRKPISLTSRITRSAVKSKPTFSRTADTATAPVSRLMLPTQSSKARSIRTRSSSNPDLADDNSMPPPPAKDLSKRHTIGGPMLLRTRSQTGRLTKMSLGQKGDK